VQSIAPRVGLSLLCPRQRTDRAPALRVVPVEAAATGVTNRGLRELSLVARDDAPMPLRWPPVRMQVTLAGRRQHMHAPIDPDHLAGTGSS